MFWRMIRGTLFRQRSKMLMIAFTIALGASLATAMINVMLGVGDKVNQELKSYGANINVMPKEASLISDLYGEMGEENSTEDYLAEKDLLKIKTIFWSLNIVDYTPYLNVQVKAKDLSKPARLVGTWFTKHLDLETGEQMDAGIKSLKKWWEIEGEWLNDHDENAVLCGSLLAERENLKVGQKIVFNHENQMKEFTVKGIFTSGAKEDEYFYTPLAAAQFLLGKSDVVSSVEVSALTTPDNDLARQAAQNPLSLTIKEWDTWYCTAYVSAICYQIQEVVDNSVVKPIRQVAESEGVILKKTQLLMLLITILSMIGSGLGISNLITASVMERSQEIGLIKAIGANNAAVVWVILCETMITALFGGVIGYFTGLGIAQIIGQTVFSSAIEIVPLAIPIVAIMVMLVTLLGSIPSIRYLLSLRPSDVLHGR